MPGQDGAGRGHPPQDPVVEQLAGSFASAPVWRRAAALVDAAAESDVYFVHRPGEAWHLAMADGQVQLRPGASADPDFVFRFSRRAVERLVARPGDRGEVALELFRLMESARAEERIDFRVAAPFARLVRRGYLRLLLSSGPRLLAFGLARGVANPTQLRRLVAASRQRGAFEWERPRSTRQRGAR